MLISINCGNRTVYSTMWFGHAYRTDKCLYYDIDLYQFAENGCVTARGVKRWQAR